MKAMSEAKHTCGCFVLGAIQMCPLHAAAPELLEALEEASEFLHDDPNDNRDSELTNLCKKVRAARGEPDAKTVRIER